MIAIEALRRQAIAHARQQAPAQHQDHEDCVNTALLAAVESGDFSIESIRRTIRTALRAARPDMRRPSRCVAPESLFRRDGSGNDSDEPEAAGDALGRVAVDAPVFLSGPEKPEPLSSPVRLAASRLRAHFESELPTFWMPAGLSPNWRSWARMIASTAGRSVNVDHVQAAMDAGHVCARGRQARDPLCELGAALVDGVPTPSREDREHAARRVGALFRLCSVDLADTRELDKKMAVAVGRSIKALRTEAAW